MDDLLNRLDLLQNALLSSNRGREIASCLAYCGVLEQYGIADAAQREERIRAANAGNVAFDGDAFERDLENPGPEHYAAGLQFVLAVLSDATAATKRAGFPEAVPMAFATAREVFNTLDPFCLLSVATSDDDHNREASDRLFDSLLDMLRGIRPDIVRAFAYVRTYVENRPRTTGQTRTFVVRVPEAEAERIKNDALLQRLGVSAHIRARLGSTVPDEDITTRAWKAIAAKTINGDDFTSCRQLAKAVGCAHNGREIKDVWQKYIAGTGKKTKPKAIRAADESLAELIAEGEAADRADRYGRRPVV